MTLPITGANRIGARESQDNDPEMVSRNPRTGSVDGPRFASASRAEVAAAAAAGQRALEVLDADDPQSRAEVVDLIAGALDRHGEQILAEADRETALGDVRLRAELGRTIGQLRTYGEAVRRGHDAPVARSTPAGSPAPVPIARGSVALGPVAVFGAGNFPLAFGALGTDTAAALAAGCPVVVKAHPSHPATSELCVRAAHEALTTRGLADALSLLYGLDDVGAALATDPDIAAVAFTGSAGGGRALMDLAARRPDPIPVFAEMGSVNPVVVTSDACRARGSDIAQALAASVLGSAGQLCTKPGVLFVPRDGGDEVRADLQRAIAQSDPVVLLDERISERFSQRVAATATTPRVVTLVDAAAQRPGLLQMDLDPGAAAESASVLRQEIFGPAAVIVRYANMDAVVDVLGRMGGQLTITIHAEEDDHAELSGVLRVARRTAGRLIWNGVPTGVPVVDAMHHGGPWPAASGAAGSVGPEALLRFRRPLAWQGFPDSWLPPTLRSANGFGIDRRVDGIQECTEDRRPSGEA